MGILRCIVCVSLVYSHPSLCGWAGAVPEMVLVAMGMSFPRLAKALGPACVRKMILSAPENSRRCRGSCVCVVCGGSGPEVVLLDRWVCLICSDLRFPGLGPASVRIKILNLRRPLVAVLCLVCPCRVSPLCRASSPSGGGHSSIVESVLFAPTCVRAEC